MSWKLIDKYRQTLASESGAIRKNWGGKLTVCLVYPNHYRTGMSNLGFQTVYQLLNSYPEVVCERAFLPDADELKEYKTSRTSLLSLESQRPLRDFDLLAFSISFENDYLNLPLIFQLSGIPLYTTQRASDMPMVMAGGAAMFLNPEPVADLMDLICLGEGEVILPGLLELLESQQNRGRQEILQEAANLPGVYVPSLYRPIYDGELLSGYERSEGAPPQVQRIWLEDLDQSRTESVILSPATEFADMYLLELSRGCPRGCRFCAAGFIYLPYRQRSVDELKRAVDEGLFRHQKLGLVGAAVSDYRGIGELCRYIMEKGGKVSVSSLRIDGLDEDMIEVLKASGHKTVALAPEGGSQRIRDLIHKNINEEQILAACDRLIGHDILNLKLYFIIGLPTETMDDLEELVKLVEKIRARVVTAARSNKRLGEVVLSINPFVPKPFTPFQWCGMEKIKSLEMKMNFIRQRLAKLANVRLQMENPRDAYLQSLLSRGDRRLGHFLVKSSELGSWKRAAKECELNTDTFVHRTIPLSEILPWDIIESSGRERLLREYQKAFGESTKIHEENMI